MPFIMINKHLAIKWFLSAEQRPYLCGVALSAQFLPLPLRIFSLLFALPLLLNLAFAQMRGDKSGPSAPVRIPALFWITLGIGLMHIYGLGIGRTVFSAAVLIDIVSIAFPIGIFALGYRPSKTAHTELMRGFFDVLIPCGLVIALIGLVKVVLLTKGYIIGPLLDLYSDIYPRGSSLRLDYNLFGLSLLAAFVGLLLRGVRTPFSWRSLILFWIPLILIVSAALLAGSRRVLFLSVPLAAFWPFLGARSVSRQAFGKQVLVPFALVLCCTSLISWGIPRMERGQEKPIVIWSLDDSTSLDAPRKIARTRSPAGIFSTVTNGSYLIAREARWRLALDLLRETKWLGGTGFSYHQVFACTFSNCASLNYPHLVFLSEWLIGGIAGLLLSLLFYLLLLRDVVRNGREGLFSGSSVLLFLVLPFSLFSGDTLLSCTPLFLAALIVQAERQTQDRRLLAKT